MVGSAARNALRACAAGLLLLSILLVGSEGWCAEPATSEGSSGLRITGPAQLFAGQEEATELEIHLGEASPATEAPVVVVSSGSVGSVRRIAQGHWAFRYQLPAEKYPQVILVAAYVRSLHQLAELRIPLHGKPVVVVQSEPGVSLEVRDGTRSFGPVQADATGRAEIRIEVPPGHNTVATFAKDSFGNITQAILPLDLPPFPGFLPVCAAEEQAVYVITVNDQVNDSGAFNLIAPGLSSGAGVYSRPGVLRVPLRKTQPVTRETPLTVRITAGNETRQCHLLVRPPPKQAPPKLSGFTTPVEPEVRFILAPVFGGISNLGKLNGFFGGLRAAYPFSRTRLGLRVEAEVSYLHSEGAGKTQNREALAVDINALPLALGLRYVLGLGAWEPSVAVGAGATGTIAHVSGSSTSSRALAAPFLLGGSLALGRKLDSFTFYAESGYWYSRLDAGGLVGNIQGVRLAVAALFEL